MHKGFSDTHITSSSSRPPKIICRFCDSDMCSHVRRDHAYTFHKKSRPLKHPWDILSLILKQFVLEGGWNGDVASRAQPLKLLIFDICDFKGLFGGQAELKSESHPNIFFGRGVTYILPSRKDFIIGPFPTSKFEC